MNLHLKFFWYGANSTKLNCLNFYRVKYFEHNFLKYEASYT